MLRAGSCMDVFVPCDAICLSDFVFVTQNQHEEHADWMLQKRRTIDDRAPRRLDMEQGLYDVSGVRESHIRRACDGASRCCWNESQSRIQR